MAPTYEYQHFNTGSLHSYGMDATVNLPGRLGVEGGYAYRDANGLNLREHRFRMRPSVEVVRHGGGSICLVAGAEYGRFYNITVPLGNGVFSTTRSHEWILPAGVGFGFLGRIAPGSTFTFYTMPQALFVRAETRAEIRGAETADLTASNHTNELAVDTGARLRHGPLFGGVSWLHTTWVGRPNVWTFTVGYVHGR